MTGRSEWTGRVGSAWADEWRRTDRSFGALTSALLDSEAIGSFAHALDVGCGAGELSERLAAAHPQASVLGMDISPELLGVARERCASLANAGFVEADAAQWCADPAAEPDLLVSRHGVMFFPDPTAAFAHLAHEAAPGARLRFSCFRSRADNGWAQALASALPPPVAETDPHAPGPFAFADRERVTAILTAAGWSRIAFEPLDYPMVAGEGEDAAAEALGYFRRIGPAARALAELPESERQAALERLQVVIETHHREGCVALPAAAWIVTAQAP